MNIDMRIPILFATETGTVELVADEIVDAYRGDARVRFQALRMDRADPTVFAAQRTYLLITSSTGKGELPRNGRSFYAALKAQAAPLTQVSYGLLGFGDRHYSASFGGGPLLLDSLMQERGATRIGAIAQHDKRSGIFPEEFALSWVAEWLALVK